MQRQPGCSTLSVVQASCLSRSSVMEEPVMFDNSTPFQSDPTAAAADAASMYVQTNLVSSVNEPGFGIFDPHLVNPWGVSFRPGSPGSPFWISDQGTNSTTLSSVAGSDGTVVNNPVPVFTVNIPPPGGPGPTGQVSNTNPDSFHLTVDGPNPDHTSANFIFA